MLIQLQEASLCEMVVRFGKPQSPPNQARLISLFPCSSPVTTRMARNISRSLLMDNASSSRGYGKLPDLSPVVDLLSPPVGSGAHFDVHGNTDKEGFYDALASRVTLLSRVLSDIDEYTSLEVQAAKEKASKRKEHGVQDGAEQNGEKGKEEEPPSIIEQIRTQLEMLHGRIGEFASNPPRGSMLMRHSQSILGLRISTARVPRPPSNASITACTTSVPPR